MKNIIMLIISTALVSWGTLSFAQVPPHRPGTICHTPQFWCWANPPGIPGLPCVCPSPYGGIRGILG